MLIFNIKILNNKIIIYSLLYTKIFFLKSSICYSFMPMVDIVGVTLHVNHSIIQF